MELMQEPVGLRYRGQEALDVSEGQWIQIKTGPANDPVTILEVQVPAGKKWEGILLVDFEEYDV